MNILTITHSFPRWSGDISGVHVHSFADALASKGHEVHILAPHDRYSLKNERMGLLRVHRFRYSIDKAESLAYGAGIFLNLRLHPILWSLLPPLLCAEFINMVHLVLRNKIDIIHAYGVLFPGLIASLGRPMLKKPVVVTSHGNELYQSRRAFQRWLIRFVLSRIDICVANSTATQTQLKLITGKDSAVVPMGISLERFSPAQLVGRFESPTLLFVGQLIEKKGVYFLLRAMREVRRSYAQIRLLIVGEGPEKQRLVELTAHLGLEDSVTFTGAVPNKDLPHYYQAADIFVLPSIVTTVGDTETLGVVLLESAASGVPLVASNVGGIKDIVRHEETGLLVEPQNSEQLAQAIIRLLSDQQLRRRLATDARLHVEQNFTLESVVTRFEGLIQKAMAS